jgi:hypothetical protein
MQSDLPNLAYLSVGGYSGQDRFTSKGVLAWLERIGSLRGVICISNEKTLWKPGRCSRTLFFTIQICLTTVCTDEPPAKYPLPKLVYDDEEYGRSIEKKLKYAPIAMKWL